MDPSSIEQGTRLPLPLSRTRGVWSSIVDHLYVSDILSTCTVDVIRASPFSARWALEVPQILSIGISYLVKSGDFRRFAPKLPQNFPRTQFHPQCPSDLHKARQLIINLTVAGSGDPNKVRLISDSWGKGGCGAIWDVSLRKGESVAGETRIQHPT